MYMKEKNNLNLKIENFDISLLKQYKNYIKKEVDDPRQPWKIEYKLWDIIVTSTIAILCNNDEMVDMHDFITSKINFFKQFLKLTNGIASKDTYERVLTLIDPDVLQDCLNQFIQMVVCKPTTEKEIISLDGKVNKGSSRKKSLTNSYVVKPLNVLNAYSSNQSLCLYSKQIDDKTNEIPNIPTVINKLNITNTVITWDALNTQTTNVEEVVKKGGDYVIPIKANQGNFYDDLKLYFDKDSIDKIRIGKSKSAYKKVIEKANSKIITYEYFQTEDIEWYHKKEDWKGLKSIGLVFKSIDDGNTVTTEKRYYISSLLNDIELFSRSIRSHWNVENKLHWHLDFTFKEDSNTTMNKRLLFNIQLIKKFCLGILEQVKDNYNISLRRIRHKLELNPESEIPKIFSILEKKRYKNS